MSPFLIAQPPIDQALTRAEWDAAVRIWRRWFSLRAREHKAPENGRLQIELRLWGFPRDRAEEVRDRLTERARQYELLQEAFLSDPDTVVLTGVEYEIVDSLADAGRWWSLLPDPLFEGLCFQLRVHIRPAPEQKSRYPHDDTLVLFGRLIDARPILMTVWAAGEQGKKETGYVRKVWDERERFLEYWRQNTDSEALPYSSEAFQSSEGPVIRAFIALFNIGFLHKLGSTLRQMLVSGVVLGFCLALRTLPLPDIIAFVVGMAALLAGIRLSWIAGFTLIWIIIAYRNGRQGLRSQNDDNRWVTFDPATVEGASDHPTLVKFGGDLLAAGGIPIGDAQFTSWSPRFQAFSRHYRFTGSEAVFGLNVTLGWGDDPSFVTVPGLSVRTHLQNGVVLFSHTDRTQDMKAPNQSGPYRVHIFDGLTDPVEMLHRHNEIVAETCRNEHAEPVPVTTETLIDRLNEDMAMARELYRRRGWNLWRALQYTFTPRRDP